MMQIAKTPFTSLQLTTKQKDAIRFDSNMYFARLIECKSKIIFRFLGLFHSICDFQIQELFYNLLYKHDTVYLFIYFKFKMYLLRVRLLAFNIAEYERIF